MLKSFKFKAELTWIWMWRGWNFFADSSLYSMFKEPLKPGQRHMRYNLSAIVAIEWPSKQIHLHRASMNISSVKLLSRVKASSRTRRSSSIYCLLSWPDHRSFIECQGPWIMAAIDEERLVALTPFIIKSHTRTQKDSLLWAPFLWTIWHLIFMSNCMALASSILGVSIRSFGSSDMRNVDKWWS